MQIDKELSKTMKTLTTKTDAVIEDVITWIKKNKTKLLVVLGIYLAIKYLFGEHTEEEEDQE